jgi:hypothetical protein
MKVSGFTSTTSDPSMLPVPIEKYFVFFCRGIEKFEARISITRKPRLCRVFA